MGRRADACGTRRTCARTPRSSPCRRGCLPRGATAIHGTSSSSAGWTALKGGAYLLDALPGTHAAIRRPLRVTFAGDGPARASWQRRAGDIAAANPEISVEFAGWLQRPEVVALLDTADLLVVPSVWPEPYGLVGPEAGRRGVPAVAFDTGGIKEWLVDGVNGCLAPGETAGRGRPRRCPDSVPAQFELERCAPLRRTVQGEG